jgi:branched-chain amino acid transport system substrate-binding protein
MRLHAPRVSSAPLRITAVSLALATAALGLAGCGSNGKAGGSGGDTITLGLITTEQSQATNLTPGVRPNAEAAVAAINKAGGIDGHEVKLKVCDQHFTSTGSAACWQRFSSDKDMIAVVGSTDCFSDASTKIIEASKLPSLARSACGLADYSNKLMFFMSGGLPVDSRALGLLAKGESIALIGYDLPAADAIVSGIRSGAEQVNGSVDKVIHITPTTADLSAAASAAIAAKTDVIIPFVNNSQSTAAIKQLKQLGYQGKILVSTWVFGKSALASLGSLADGVIGESSGFPAVAADASGALFEQYQKELDAIGEDKPVNYGDFTNWLAFHAFAQIAAGDGVEFTRAGILKALRAQTSFEYAGSTPAFDLAGATPGPIKDAPRTTNPWIGKLVAKDGEWSWDGKWINTFDPEQVQ